jgi:Tol biopolymer transport system component
VSSGEDVRGLNVAVNNPFHVGGVGNVGDFDGPPGQPDQQSGRILPDGHKLFFLGKRNADEIEELWYADLLSGQTERAVPGMVFADTFDLSPDGSQIAFDSPDASGNPHIWLAWLDRRSPPRQMESKLPENDPIFGPAGDLFFQVAENGSAYQRPLNGGEGRKISPHPVTRFESVSPDGKWAVADAPIFNEDVKRGVLAFNVRMERSHGFVTRFHRALEWRRQISKRLTARERRA